MKIFKWKDDFAELKRQKQLCASIKKEMEDKLTSDDACKKVLSWIHKDGDPELSLDSTFARASSQRLYCDFGQWLLDAAEFRGWSNAFQNAQSEEAKKQALWISGSYGTGKSTLMSVTHPNTLMTRRSCTDYLAGAASLGFCRP
jgi:hypothetical protein